ncbi:molybdate transport system regulatory protein [Methanohalophilus levihalophilus]|uniref:TOBE domain-containing protein n=1 Tax=Methanohalophilus levihalophilus TaxID=1431282 RepID=UPI001AE41DE8|nr:molybdate transport system regulatory protein [Methanohalophilus levihalophilus]
MERKAKVWLSHEGKPVLGAGKAELLLAIDEEGSLQKACKKLDISYKHAWNIIKSINERLGEDVVRTVRGGKKQGTFLTEYGRKLIVEYEKNRNYVDELMADEVSWENLGIKLSARNRLLGKIVEIEKGDVACKLKIEVEPSILTSLITAEAVESLDLTEGDEVFAIIKSTEVLVGKPSGGSKNE